MSEQIKAVQMYSQVSGPSYARGTKGLRDAVEEACTYNSYEGGAVEGVSDDLLATRRVVSKLVEILVEKGVMDEIDVLKLLTCSQFEWTLAPAPKEEGT